MQEEVNQKVISLSIQGVKITASVLKAAIRKFLEMDNRRKQKATQVKMAEKTGRAQEKGREKARKRLKRKATWKADHQAAECTGSTAFQHKDHR